MRAREQLWEVGVEQYGYVTLRDAERLGIDSYAVRMLVAREQLDRVAHGVYRFPQWPVAVNDPYMLAVLWTGVEGACLSHDTALDVYDVCDVNPSRIHVTVGRHHRIRRRGGELYVVHHEDLAKSSVGWWEGIPTVTLPTALVQCLTSGVATYLLRQALDAGAATGAIPAHDVNALRMKLDDRDQRR